MHKALAGKPHENLTQNITQRTEKPITGFFCFTGGIMPMAKYRPFWRVYG